MNIQEAIKSEKPFRREGGLDDGIFLVYPEHDIVLTLDTDPFTSIELDIQDILADDWYTRKDVNVASQAKQISYPKYIFFKETK